MTEPRSGRALILATKPYEAERPVRSWAEVAATFAVYGACIAVVMAPLPLALRVGLAVFAGVVQFRFLALLHDHLHGALLARSKPGRWLMSAIGLWILVPRSAWKETHSFHHQHNGKLKWTSIGSYPVMTTTQHEQATPAQRRKYAVIRHPLSILGGYFMVGIRGLCIQAFLRAPRRHFAGPIALVLHFSAFGALWWGLGLVDALLVWTLPIFVHHAFSSYLFYAQHNFPETRFFDTGEWSYTDAAVHGSSFLEMNPVMHWITANIGYHHVHHLNHKVPFYRLPEAMAGIEELQSPHRTSFRLRDVMAALRLHTWDPARRRMQPASEAAAAEEAEISAGSSSIA